MKKSILAIVFTLALFMLLLPHSSLPAYAAGTERTVTTFAELKSAISTSNDGDTIIITKPIEATEQLEIKKSLTITASGDGKLTRSSSFTVNTRFYGNIFRIENRSLYDSCVRRHDSCGKRLYVTKCDIVILAKGN